MSNVDIRFFVKGISDGVGLNISKKEVDSIIILPIGHLLLFISIEKNVVFNKNTVYKYSEEIRQHTKRLVVYDKSDIHLLFIKALYKNLMQPKHDCPIELCSSMRHAMR